MFNLTLTKYNPELSNSSFDDKKMIYGDSNIKMTRDISYYEKWDKDSIISRADKKLADNLYLEVHHSGKDTINYIKLFTKEYEMDEFFEFVIGY